MRAGSDGALAVESAHYRLDVASDGSLARLSSPEGRYCASLRLLAAIDCVDRADETLSVEPPRLVDGGGAPQHVATGPVITIERRSTCWLDARLTLVCRDDALEIRASVGGRGRLADAHVLGGRSVIPGGATGFLSSGAGFRTLFSPNPGDPRRLLHSASETAVIGALGGSEPGRGHWFFTPAPLLFAATEAEGLAEPAEPVSDGWTALSIVAPIGELTFVEVAYEGVDLGFSERLDYDGHTAVDGEFTTPALVLTPGLADPYTGLRRYRAELAARAAAPPPRTPKAPAWWSEPIFCGWGEQCYLRRVTGHRAAELSTQANYDSFLGHLESRGVVPGTVVIDDKWQEAYGTCVADRDKWPDLRRWIAERHGRGQRVLLWWKAWDPEGLDADLCIRNPDGAPIAFDPTNPAGCDALRETITHMLGPDGVDADGLKIDFTARSPSGRALTSHGPGWGIALLHQLLALVYDAAKRAKPDALVITHTPHPSFADVTDMIRLNDMLRLDDPNPVAPIVPQMRYRADVVRAACPDVLIDTDDWCVPSRAAWREYVEAKPELGVPSLYYATHFDFTGEPLEAEDYEALRRTWTAWRAARFTR